MNPLHNYLEHILPEMQSSKGTLSQGKIRWGIIENKIYLVDNWIHPQLQKPQKPSYKIEKVFELMAQQLEQFKAKGISKEDIDLLDKLSIKVKEKVDTYNRRHFFIYKLISKILFGDVNKFQKNIQSQITRLKNQTSSEEGADLPQFEGLDSERIEELLEKTEKMREQSEEYARRNELLRKGIGF